MFLICSEWCGLLRLSFVFITIGGSLDWNVFAVVLHQCGPMKITKVRKKITESQMQGRRSGSRTSAGRGCHFVMVPQKGWKISPCIGRISPVRSWGVHPRPKGIVWPCGRSGIVSMRTWRQIRGKRSGVVRCAENWNV